MSSVAYQHNRDGIFPWGQSCYLQPWMCWGKSGLGSHTSVQRANPPSHSRCKSRSVPQAFQSPDQTDLWGPEKSQPSSPGKGPIPSRFHCPHCSTAWATPTAGNVLSKRVLRSSIFGQHFFFSFCFAVERPKPKIEWQLTTINALLRRDLPSSPCKSKPQVLEKSCPGRWKISCPGLTPL